MGPGIGRRAAHKTATKAALQEAASRLFAEQGYEATTVHQIAAGAHVTERTFHRYFDGKEGLLAEGAVEWVRALQDEIVRRPRAEAPFVAVRRAMVALTRRTGPSGAAAPFWRVIEMPQPLQRLQRTSPRPLRRLEAAITDAIQARLSARSGTEEAGLLGADEEYESQVLGRVAVAALRSAVIRHRQSETDDETSSPGVEELLETAFKTIASHAGAKVQK